MGEQGKESDGGRDMTPEKRQTMGGGGREEVQGWRRQRDRDMEEGPLGEEAP